MCPADKSDVKTRFIFTTLLLFALGCGPKFGDEDSEDNTCFAPGDIIVSNSGSGSVLAFESNGTFRRVVFSTNPVSEKPYGLAWNSSTQEIIIAVGTSRVMAVNMSDCTERTLVSDTNLSGALRGIAVLTGADLLIAEANNVERFTPASPTWTRITAGGWPRALQTTPTMIAPMSNGGFVHCSTGTDVVRTYNSAGTQVATRASGIATTTDANGCIEMSNGNIATVWNGTTDTVSIYDSTLTTSLFTFSDLANLGNPGGIAQRANGNLLITERTNHLLMEITATGSYVGTLAAGSVLSTPEYILVVP